MKKSTINIAEALMNDVAISILELAKEEEFESNFNLSQRGIEFKLVRNINGIAKCVKKFIPVEEIETVQYDKLINHLRTWLIDVFADNEKPKLKKGMIVITRDNLTNLVCEDIFENKKYTRALDENDCVLNLDSFDNDLRNIICSKYDIIKIYEYVNNKLVEIWKE